MTEKELRENIDGLADSLKKIEARFSLTDKKNELALLDEELEDPNLWQNQERAEEVSKQASELRDFIKQFEEIKSGVEILKDNPDEGIFFETRRRAVDLEIKTLFSGSYDKGSAIVSIYAGAGGQDAFDWAGMLFDMYEGYAKRQGFKLSILEENLEEAPKSATRALKNITFEVVGSYAFGYLKGEAGVHRLVRISPYSAKKLRHTSFALVEVLPDLPSVDEDNIKIPDEDLRIDLYRSSGPGGQNVNKVETAVRITHIPTGMVGSSQSGRSQSQNKEKAMNVLRSKLFNLLEQKQIKELKDLKINVKPEWGSQIRSYVLHPYKMVKDHRTDEESSSPDEVLSGDLDKFIEAELTNLANNPDTIS